MRPDDEATPDTERPIGSPVPAEDRPTRPSSPSGLHRMREAIDAELAKARREAGLDATPTTIPAPPPDPEDT